MTHTLPLRLRYEKRYKLRECAELAGKNSPDIVFVFIAINAEQARTLLATAGCGLALQDLQIEERDDRWAVLLPDDGAAYPRTCRGHGRLAIISPALA